MKSIAAILAACAMLTACATPGEGRSPLAGSTWKFTQIDGASPVSDRAQLSFEKGSIGANVGCNAMGGPWRLENGRLIAGPLVQTEMYCEGPVWDQEKAVSALLSAAPRFELRGETLTLKSSGHAATLKRIEKR